MNPWQEMILQMAATIIISTVKNPQSIARIKPLLFKIAAVIYVAAEQMGATAELDAKVAEEVRKVKP